LGIGDWGLGPIPNPQSPIPNPQSPIPNPHLKKLKSSIKNILLKSLIFSKILKINKNNFIKNEQRS
jgi:hypothetical protein